MTNSINGINYQNILPNLAINGRDRLIERNRIAPYHQGCSPIFLNTTSTKVDLQGMTKKQIEANTKIVDGNIKTKFTIGMEVEKMTLPTSVVTRRQLKKNPTLFAAIEDDSTVVYEAITNILPLVPSSKWRNKVFNMMTEAKEFINEEFASSNTLENGAYKCGGHITIANEKFDDSKEYFESLRPYVAVFYAMNKKRLANRWCYSNLNVESRDQRTNHIIPSNGKYSPINLKPYGCVEFRLFSRFTSVIQMKNRYKLMQILCECADNRTSVAKFNKLILPILTKMYESEDKAKETIALAKSFNKLLMKDKIDEKILPFLYSRNNNYSYNNENGFETIAKRFYTPKALRMWRSGEIKFSKMVG
tara:strand:+ start:98 stop:1183 length:1086 start_codon:yes stop_codon:yes gene_type:complete